MNARAAQGRSVFDGTVVPVLRSPAFVALAFLAVVAPLGAHVALRASEQDAANRLGRRKLEALTLAGTVVFVGTIAWLLVLRIALGRLDATDVHPEWCAMLSSTNRLGIPVAAVGYLAGFAVTAHQLAVGLHAALPSLPRAARAPRATWSIDAACVGVFVLCANGTFYFAGGAPLF